MTLATSVKLLICYHAVNLSVMPKLRRDLHIYKNLVTFEAASRTGNFTRAAEELGLSRVAVSRQIAELEMNLGQRLFLRGHRKVSLTAAGSSFAEALNPALHAIADLLERQRVSPRGSRVTVTVTSAFATYWLMPRLAGFGADHPDIEINLIVSDRYLDISSEGLDIIVRYMPATMADESWTPLVRETIFPVFSPNYAARTALAQPEDLLRERLLHLSGRYRAEARWPHWFRQHDLQPPEERSGIQVNTYPHMLQAALGGQGVALAGHPLVDGFLKDGTLLRMKAINAIEREYYYLRVATMSESSRLFCDWLVDEVQKDDA
ncbi:LysR substrate-binding domain-containing protein [Roseovarius aquimarinus]|uniref:LysR substrate-binding domain-containing protein n=1 Tax=Roseovarius aquimarinus TaxID=1229156 RepID=A0ABW7I741_9RHOB